MNGQNRHNRHNGTNPTEQLRAAAMSSSSAQRVYGQHSGYRKLKAQAHWLTERLLDRQAQDFEKSGGFSERLYKARTSKPRGSV